MARQSIKKLLVANRSEIAIRVFRAASELGIRTVAVYAPEDKLSQHRFDADEAFLIGRGKGPREAYLSVDELLRIARDAKVDAIHPGYGFLSESPEFAEACAASGITFIGPRPDTMRILGDKVAARTLAVTNGVSTLPATGPLPEDFQQVLRQAEGIGYPLMLKACWGGGGRGMRPIEGPDRLLEIVRSAKRESKAAFGKEDVYLEKLVRRARHVEVQILGDEYGNVVHLFERDCSIQRRQQKIVECAPAPNLSDNIRTQLYAAALRIGRASSCVSAATVEFLLDADSNEFYFIEVNPRIQVEHTVTEQVTGLDLVKAQIRISEGGHLGKVEETGIPAQEQICLNGHALQCRITAEDPLKNFAPDHGSISGYRGASGLGIRIDNGNAHTGASINRHYDSLLEKVVAWAPTRQDAIARMLRALREYSIHGIATNLAFLEAVLKHPQFRAGHFGTDFIDATPDLLGDTAGCDAATKLLSWIADVTVNGHPEMRGRSAMPAAGRPTVPAFEPSNETGSKQIFQRLGPARFAKWLREQRRVLLTDTTMRDAHQSLLATRVRTYDLVPAASAYARGLPGLLSLECWGGATFDVAMRFLQEDPWERLALIRERVPNILLQMLFRGANGVGYTNYPDNVVQYFVRQAALAGIDLFRIFDCLNWVENMRVAIDAAGAEGKLVEGAICYTGDITNPDRSKYSLRYYVEIAKELERAGCHLLAIKDMAGLLKPEAAKILVRALRDSVELPLHLHTHDTSGISAATVLSAVEAGVDAVDAAMDAMSGTTSQPCLGSIVEALRHTRRDTGLDPASIRRISNYWEAVRRQYRAFETDQKSGTCDVYVHQIPGGQLTNLREQARTLGLDDRWAEVAEAYRTASGLFGDIPKVTPSSKVVGDMALLMVARKLTPEEILDPKQETAFPTSVIEMFRGDIGQPPGGWPSVLQRKVLKDEAPITVRPGSLLAETDLQATRRKLEETYGRAMDEQEFASTLMYPDLAGTFYRSSAKYGPVSVLPTNVFFYGLRPGHETTVEMDQGKTFEIRLVALGEPDERGMVRVFFEINGQLRIIDVLNRSTIPRADRRRKGDEGDPTHVMTPMAGVVTAVPVELGQRVQPGDVLATIEAMKMETAITAPKSGFIADIAVAAGCPVEAKDLLMVVKDGANAADEHQTLNQQL